MTELTMKEMARKGGLATKAKHPEQFKEMARARWAKSRSESGDLDNASEKVRQPITGNQEPA